MEPWGLAFVCLFGVFENSRVSTIIFRKPQAPRRPFLFRKGPGTRLGVARRITVTIFGEAGTSNRQGTQGSQTL